jgi:hypothetical protein
MYIDNLTIAALVIFAVFFAVFVKFCILNICGLSCEDKEELQARLTWQGRS